MFDLFRSRDKAVRILLGALLVLVGLSMLTYLIPSYGNGSSSNDVVIAEVGSEKVTLPEVQQAIQNAMRGRQVPSAILPQYIPSMIDNMIDERAMAYEAERLGFVVTEDQVANAIRTYLPNLFPDGKFLGKEAYASVLAQQNMTIPQFESEVKRQELINWLRRVALEGTIVTPQEVDQEYKKRNEKVKIEYVKLTADKYKSESQPSAADVQQSYDLDKAKYMTPERKNLTILIADQAKIEQTVNPTDAELQKVYQQNIAAFRTPEQVKVRHILLLTKDKPAAEEAKAKAQAEDLLKQVRAGANFGELVKKYSEDPGSKNSGGEYTVQRNGQMVPEFEKAAFSLKPGESDVIKTSYGYHVIQVMQHDQPRVKPFEEVKAQLAADYKKQRVNDLMQQISDKAQTMLQKDPNNADKVAAELNMQVVRADGWEAGKPVPEIGINGDFDQSVASLRKGEASQAVALPGNKIAVAVARDVIPPHQAPFAEVENTIRESMTTKRAAVAVQKHAQELLDKAKSMGGDLEKAAKSMGLEVKTSDDVMRTGAVEGIGSASYITEAFGKPNGTVFGPVATPDATVVGKVLTHTDADPSKLTNDERAKLRDEIKMRKGRDRGTLFESGLRETLTRQGKIKIHQDVIKRLVAQYQGA